MAQLRICWQESTLLVAVWLLMTTLPKVHAAGGRGGAIATKGGTRLMGPRKSDPNVDSGSLSVILVVILPVVQMFFFVALIILVRMCYRHYCLKSKPSQSRKSMVQHRNTAKLKSSASALRNAEKPVAIAMTSSSVSNVSYRGGSTGVARDNNDTYETTIGELEMNSNVDNLVDAVPESSNFQVGSDSTLSPQPTGLSAVIVHRSSRSSSVSPVDPVCSTKGNQLYSPPLSNHHQLASISSGTCSAAVAAASTAVVASNLIPQTVHCSKATHSLPLSMCAVTAASASASAYKRSQIMRSTTLNDGIESLNSETINSVGKEEEEEEEDAQGIISGQVSVELPLDCHSTHQIECIFHPQHFNSKRPTSANSTASFKCMQTY